MAYGLIETRGRIDDYASAKAKYESIEPIRGRSGDIRPLATRRNDNLTIRKHGDDYVVRLYATDVVTYHANGDVSFLPYASRSTNAVVGAYGPVGVGAEYTSKAGMILRVSHPNYHDSDTARGIRFYDIGTGATLHPDGSLTGTRPLRKFSAAPKAMRDKVLEETGFARFQTWLRTVHRLGAMPAVNVNWRWSRYGSDIDGRTLVDFVKDGTMEGYKGALEAYATTKDLENPTRLLGKMRLAIYACTGCVREEYPPYVTSWAQLNAIEKGIRTYDD